MRTLPTLAAAVAVAAVIVASPAFAEDHGGSGGARCGDGCLIATSVIAAAFDVGFLAVGIPLLAMGGGFGPGWSIVEIIWGAAQGLAGIILTPIGAVGLALGNDGGPYLGAGVLLLVVAVWLITHGIISLVRYFRRDAPPAPAPLPARPPIRYVPPPARAPAPAPGDMPVPPPPPLESIPEQTGLEQFLPTLTSSIGPRGASVGLGWAF